MLRYDNNDTVCPLSRASVNENAAGVDPRTESRIELSRRRARGDQDLASQESHIPSTRNRNRDVLSLPNAAQSRAVIVVRGLGSIGLECRDGAESAVGSRLVGPRDRAAIRSAVSTAGLDPRSPS